MNMNTTTNTTYMTDSKPNIMTVPPNDPTRERLIIDFHTHTFPDSLARRAVLKLSQAASLKNYLDGTLLDLKKSMQRSGIHYSVLLPVATKTEHYLSINSIAKEVNATSKYDHLISFGSLHPDNANYKEIIDDLADYQVPGIKLQPINQLKSIDDISYLRIIDYAVSMGLYVLIHAGYDISSPGAEFSTVAKLKNVVNTIHSEKIILAHMGGINEWDLVEEWIIGKDVCLDTSFVLTPLRHICQNGNVTFKEDGPLPMEQFIRMVRNHGVNRILFGSDSPWSDQGESLKAILKSPLTEEEKTAILGENAKHILTEWL